MKALQKQLPDLGYLQLQNTHFNYQLSLEELIEVALLRKEGKLTDTGALAVDTGTFTGRSPQDRFIVDDHFTHNTVNWGSVNLKFNSDKFESLYQKMTAYLSDKTIFVRDSAASANEKYRINTRTISEMAYQDLFVHHLFIRQASVIENPEWTIIAAPGFSANPETDGTRQKNFSIISFAKKTILIGGTGYTGEIKKAIFSVLNFLLPQQDVLPMHCSANIGLNGDTAIFFGLSGTGKTTLSADPDRYLIGDDEHGWSDYSVFNFEGGCYAKCASLSAESEPQIFNAIRYGALLENINFQEGTRKVNYANIDKTENTRVAYPLNFISNSVISSIGPSPKNIFFLTADAFGVLPPISKLNVEQAMYYFVTGYTAKVAGTEAGITEPKATFSACFGEAFMPLHPMVYARLLGKKIKEQQINVWLINTGWVGGAYGVGQRIKLAYTRAMVNAALQDKLNDVKFLEHPVFKLKMPVNCPSVPDEILNPVNTWSNKEDYFKSAAKLTADFAKNFEKYSDHQIHELAFTSSDSDLAVI